MISSLVALHLDKYSQFEDTQLDQDYYLRGYLFRGHLFQDSTPLQVIHNGFSGLFSQQVQVLYIYCLEMMHIYLVADQEQYL